MINIPTTVYEETLTGRPHDTSVQKATSDDENVDAVQRHTQDAWLSGDEGHDIVMTINLTV